MKKIIFKFLASILVLLCFNFAAQAKEKYNLVLFYADWNVYSGKAIDVLSAVAANSSKQITFEKVNIDDEKAFIRIKQLGIMPTTSMPYYFLINKKKKVIYNSIYNDESEQELNQKLLEKIKEN